MASENSTLFFIPDISGFTHFVRNEEIEHSRHIISELLEILIDSNILNLEISEIEGDAILFYRFGNVASLQEIVLQSKNMFLKFHEHLKLYERDRICDCGACTTTNQLSLKVFVHFGVATLLQVKNHQKLLGEDIIVAHRLMKNSINSDEYVLVTKNYIRHLTNDNTNISNIEWKEGKENYSDLGDINYQYYLLSSLHKEVKIPPPRPEFIGTFNPMELKIEINAPLKTVFEVVSNIEMKTKHSGAKEVVYNKEKVLRVGTKHDCILPDRTLHFETIGYAKKNDSIEYVEKMQNLPLLGEAESRYILKRENLHTLVTFQIHFKEKNFLKQKLFLMMKLMLKIQFKQVLKAIKRYAEEQSQS